MKPRMGVGCPLEAFPPEADIPPILPSSSLPSVLKQTATLCNNSPTHPQGTEFLTPRRLLILSALLAGLAAVCAATWTLAWRAGLAALQRDAGVRADQLTATLQGTLERYESLPYLIGTQPLVQDVLAAPRPDWAAAANRYLEDVNRHARATTTYIIGADGRCVAASNWRAADSFVGVDYRFRPYYAEAAHGGVGRFFGIGTISHDPGYYVSQPVLRNGAPVGVAVVKLNLEWFPGADAAEPVLVTDEHGVIFLSSVPQWKYHALRPLPPALAASIDATQQYARQPLPSLPLHLDRTLDGGAEIVRIGHGLRTPRYLETRRALGTPNWQIVTMSPLAPVAFDARSLAVMASSGYLCVCLLGFYWRMRSARVREIVQGRAALQKAYAQLNERVAERTADLSEANRHLQHEVAERTRAEHELRAAQDELIQASKLAALGQMAAGITHELNQPLAALRSFSDNSRVLLERGAHDAVRDNLEAIALLTERMGKITNQLKLFVGRARPGRAQADLARALRNALGLLGKRLDGVRITLEWPGADSEPGATRSAGRPAAAQATPAWQAGDAPRTESESSQSTKREPARNGRPEPMPPPEPWRDAPVLLVRCDELRLEQVLINVIGNALDAIAGATAPALAVSIEARGRDYALSVRDNGPGIPADVLPHLFEPFFTTKEMGHGMGLGLTIASTIARDYGGSLSAHNMPDGGACFVLALPRAPMPDPAP